MAAWTSPGTCPSWHRDMSLSPAGILLSVYTCPPAHPARRGPLLSRRGCSGHALSIALVLSEVADLTAPPSLWGQTASESRAPSVSESLLSGTGGCLCRRVLCRERRPGAVRLPQDQLLAVSAVVCVLGPHVPPSPRTSTLDADSGFRAFSPR